MTGNIRAWHAPAKETRKPVIWKPEPAATELVRDAIWEKARHDGHCMVERRMTELCPKVIGGRRTGADLARELAPVPEPEDKRNLSDPIKPRSYRKVPNGGRLKLTGAAHGAYHFHPSALGE
jgi:hypothetical protein